MCERIPSSDWIWHLRTMESLFLRGSPGLNTAWIDTARMIGSHGRLRGTDRLRTLKLLMLRLTPRAMRRRWLVMARREVTSLSGLASQRCRSSGGKSCSGGQAALQHAHGVDEGQTRGRLAGRVSRLVHQAPDGGMGEQRRVDSCSTRSAVMLRRDMQRSGR